jgi:hypothetical protein
MTAGDTDTDTNMTDGTDDPEAYVAGDTDPTTDTEHHLGGDAVATESLQRMPDDRVMQAVLRFN